MKPLSVDLPYPTLEGLSPDCLSLGIISPAYASAEGELNATLQYIYHSFAFWNTGHEEWAQDLQAIAISEMHHLDLLGKTITKLGAKPVYCLNPATFFSFYSTKFVSYSNTLLHMIEDDILSEKHAIAQYEKMLKRLKNEQVIKIVSRILEDEFLHLKKFEEILSKLKG